MSDKTRILLNVEDEDERKDRLNRLFDATTSTTSAASTSSRTTVLPQERKTYKVPPPTDLLARLNAFLPQMKEANEELTRKIEREGKGSVDIGKVDEITSDSDSESEDDSEDEDDQATQRGPQNQYIEMNLGLGVFEQRPIAGVPSTSQKEMPRPPFNDIPSDGAA